jgi:hypothetical protein
METVVGEVLQLWLRGARIPEVVEVLELVKGELQGRNVRMEFTVDDRSPEGGPGK